MFVLWSSSLAVVFVQDLLELADNLGPARPQGLTKATLDRLPVTHFEKSADKEDQR